MVETAIVIIRIAVGITMVVFGIHQIMRPASWTSYLPDQLQKRLTLSTNTFMRLHGSGNAVLGALFLIGLWPFILAWLVLIWWVAILPFAFYSGWGVGMRDLTIIGSLVALLSLLWPVR